MKIELRRISYSKRLSQETSAFTADVWVDGVKRGTAENTGTGGPNMISPFALENEIEAFAKTLPPVEAYGMTIAPSADLVISDLLEEHLVQKDLARAMKGKTLFTATNGKLYSVKGTVAPRDAVQVLNTMPAADALALYRRVGAR